MPRSLINTASSYSDSFSDNVYYPEINNAAIAEVQASPNLEDWSNSTKEAIDSYPQIWTRSLLYLLLVFVGIFLPWTFLAKIDETGTARGRLEPKGKSVELDSSVSGSVVDIKVREGQHVKAGQILMKLDLELALRSLERAQVQLEGQQNRLVQSQLFKNQLIIALQTQQQQNQAQQLEKQIQVEQALENYKSLKTTYDLQKEEKQAQIAQAKQAIEASKDASKIAKVRLEGAREKLNRYQEAYNNQVVSQDRYQEAFQTVPENEQILAKANSETRQSLAHMQEISKSYEKVTRQAQSEIQQARLRLEETKRSYESLKQSGKLSILKSQENIKNLETQITSLNSEIAQNLNQIQVLKFQLAQRIIRAPISGTIFLLPVSKPGAFVQSGSLISKIAPDGVPLVLKANMPIAESGFVHKGLPVKLKFDAYPFQDYGIVAGHLNWVSPDSKPQPTAKGVVDSLDLEITLNKDSLDNAGKKITLSAGQSATAEVVIRQRRVIDFLLDPFKKLQTGGIKL